jgi:hypothetical protein
MRAPGAVDTRTPTLASVLGCRRVTDAFAASGAGGEAVGVEVGEAVAATDATCGVDEQPATASTAAIAAPAATINTRAGPQTWDFPPVMTVIVAAPIAAVYRAATYHQPRANKRGRGRTGPGARSDHASG